MPVAGCHCHCNWRMGELGTLAVDSSRFLLDGKPFRMLAGAMSYFRVHPALWEDRLRKLRAIGINTVETYVAWNLHEPAPGEFRFDGNLDLGMYPHSNGVPTNCNSATVGQGNYLRESDARRSDVLYEAGYSQGYKRHQT